LGKDLFLNFNYRALWLPPELPGLARDPHESFEGEFETSEEYECEFIWNEYDNPISFAENV